MATAVLHILIGKEVPQDCQAGKSEPRVHTPRRGGKWRSGQKDHVHVQPSLSSTPLSPPPFSPCGPCPLSFSSWQHQPQAAETPGSLLELSSPVCHSEMKKKREKEGGRKRGEKQLVPESEVDERRGTLAIKQGGKKESEREKKTQRFFFFLSRPSSANIDGGQGHLSLCLTQVNTS